MKYVIVLMMAMAAGSLHAQTADVIQLSASDAKEAAELDAQQKVLEAKVEAFQKHIRDSYLTETLEQRQKEGGGSYSIADSVPVNDSGITFGCINVIGQPPCPETKPVPDTHRYYKMNWDMGRFEFSRDFRFIVPKAAPPGSNYGFNSCGVFTPAVNW